MKKAVQKCLFLTLLLVFGTAIYAQNTCLQGWRYTRMISVENYEFGLLHDWQVRVEFDTQSLIAAGKMNPDGSDIRFTSSDCCTQLPYWIQSGLNTPQTVVWVRVPQLSSYDTTWCQLYYGNPNATTPISDIDLVHFSIGNDSMGTDTALPGVTVSTQAYRFPFDAVTVRFRVFHQDTMRLRFKTLNDTNMVTYVSPFFSAPRTTGFDNFDVEMLASNGGHFGWYASIGGNFMNQCTPNLPCPGSCGDAVARPLDWGVFGAIKTDTCGFLPSMKVWYRRSTSTEPYADAMSWSEFDRYPGFATSAPNGNRMCFTDSLPVIVHPVGAIGYQWFRNGLPINGATDTSYVAHQSGAYHCVADFGIACRSIGSDTTTLSYFSPEVDLGPDQSVCSDTGTTIHAGLGFNSYLWSDNSTLESLHISTTGNYSVTVSDSLGCLNSDTVHIALHPIPVPVITPNGPTTVCQGAQVPLNGIDPRWYAYQWLPYGQTSANIAVTTGGSYQLIVWDQFFCSDTSVILPVIVHPTPSIELGPPADICLGDSVVLDAGTGWQSIKWPDFSNQQTFTVFTTGFFRVDIVDTFGCKNADTAQVTVHFPPTTDLGPSDSLCPTATLPIDAGAGFVSYAWNNGATTQTVNVGPGIYSVVVTDSFGCVSAPSTAVYFIAYPSLTPPTVSGTASLLTASSSPNYQWYFNGTLIAGATGQTYVPTESGTYSVGVTDPYGCTDALSPGFEVVLEIKAEDIPQGFSPNGDGINDRFEIRRITDFPNSSLIVMNRWGQKVFEEAPYTNSFNGTAKGGSDLPDGTYFYILSTGDGKEFQDYLIINR